MKKIDDLEQLKREATDTNLECCVLLVGGARSSKTLTYFPGDDTWDVMHAIDDTWEEDLSTDRLRDSTNIITALERGALWAYYPAEEEWTYTGHYKDHAEGHIFLGHDVKGGVTIQLTGASSMTQERLDELGKRIVDAVNKEKTGGN